MELHPHDRGRARRGDRRRRGLRGRGHPGAPGPDRRGRRPGARLPARRRRRRARAGRAPSTQRAPAGETLGPLAGVPLALKDVFTTKGMPTTCRLADPRGLAPAVRRDDHRSGCARPALVILGKTNMDEFAMGSSTENSRVRPDPQPVGPGPHPRRLVRRLGGRGGRATRRRWPSAPTPAARSASPPRSAGIVGAKPTYGGSSRYGLVAFASSLDTPARSPAPCSTPRCCTR